MFRWFPIVFYLWHPSDSTQKKFRSIGLACGSISFGSLLFAVVQRDYFAGDAEWFFKHFADYALTTDGYLTGPFFVLAGVALFAVSVALYEDMTAWYAEDKSTGFLALMWFFQTGGVFTALFGMAVFYIWAWEYSFVLFALAGAVTVFAVYVLWRNHLDRKRQQVEAEVQSLLAAKALHDLSRGKSTP